MIKEGDGLMDWDRIGAWFWTVIAFFFILGFVLQSFPIVLTVIVLSLLVIEFYRMVARLMPREVEATVSSQFSLVDALMEMEENLKDEK